MVYDHLALLIAQADSNIGTESVAKLQDRLLGLLDIFINNIILPIGSGLIIIALILAGFKYIQGDPKSGKSAVMAAVIGLVIVLVSKVIVYQIVVDAIKGGGN